MRNFIYGIIVGCLIPFLAGYAFLKTGGMPVATNSAPLPLERFIAHTAMHVALKNEHQKQSPVPNTEENLLAGAHAYINHCSMCHGGIGTHPSVYAVGLFPKPPQLFEPDQQVTDDPVGVTYWKIANGIRMTGMPAFSSHLNETETWQVSQLLFYADKLPPSVQEVLQNVPHHH